MTDSPHTVGDYIRRLQEFPEDWPVMVATPAGGGIAIEHREVQGNPVIAIFGDNGGCFGESPLTEAEYHNKAKDFVRNMREGYSYTHIHGDDRLYLARGGGNDTCYGTHYDPRIIERMVAEGIIEKHHSTQGPYAYGFTVSVLRDVDGSA